MSKYVTAGSFLLLLFVGAAAVVEGQNQAQPVPLYVPPMGYVCYRATGPLEIDGKLNDRAWNNAPWTEDFVDIKRGNNKKPRLRTRAKMLWDDEYFYIGAELQEPHVWGTYTAHDSPLYQQNNFEFFIDPNGDNHEYYEFEINALNTIWDLYLTRPYRDGGAAISSWEILGLKHAVDVRGTLNDPRDVDQGWTVELAVPWKVLKEAAHKPAPPKEGDQWRVNLMRAQWQHEIVDGKYGKVPKMKSDFWVWSPQRLADIHHPEDWGYVQFTRKEPDAVQFVPDATGAARHLLHQVYYRQVDFKKNNKRWATSLDELGLKDLTDPSLSGPVQLQTTESLFEAIAPVKFGGQRIHIRQDSLIWQTK